jgi:hypothetical protein
LANNTFEKIINLMKDDEEINRLGCNGWESTVKNHNPIFIGLKMETFIKNI